MRADRIIASDDPERVFAPAILLEAALPTGRSRLYYNHVNGGGTDLVLALVLANDAAGPVDVTYSAAHGGPGVDAIAVGHLASAAFLQTANDLSTTLEPKENVSLIARVFSAGTYLCGIFEIEVAQPIRAIVAASAPGVAPRDAIVALRLARSDGASRGGIFPLRGFEAVSEIAAGQSAMIGDLPILSTANTPLKGNYAVVRTFDFVLPMDGGATAAASLVFEPSGGPAAGTFIVAGTSHEVARTPAGQAVRVVDLPPSTPSPVRVVTTAELNSSYPARLSLQSAPRRLAAAAVVTTVAGMPSSRGLTALANASKPVAAASRVMEPLAGRLLKEPDSLLPHRYDVILQLDTTLARSLTEMQGALERLFKAAGLGSAPPVDSSHGYVAAQLTRNELTRLLKADDAAQPVLVRVWEDHEIHPLLVDSVPIVKGDAAHSAFAAFGDGIVWAVLDSGIDQHPHFTTYANLELPAGLTHRDFTGRDGPVDVALEALADPYGHGTHVAGIIAGAWTGDAPPFASRATRSDPDAPIVRGVEQMRGKPTGVAPRAKLLSMRVIDANGGGKASMVVAALDEIFRINGYGAAKRIHGVNLSTGYYFDPTWDACGRTPICEAVNRLVDSGVVVVVAAGNSGDILAAPLQSAARPVGLLASINDPGNAERAITVASCYNREPFTDGVAASSSKGPTADGRAKPDITAPGERVTSCANAVTKKANDSSDYVEMSGTSMAAPHVSGAVASFLSVRREFIGRPPEVKARITRHATDLGRDRAFQGAGLINLFAMLAE